LGHRQGSRFPERDIFQKSWKLDYQNG